MNRCAKLWFLSTMAKLAPRSQRNAHCLPNSRVDVRCRWARGDESKTAPCGWMRACLRLTGPNVSRGTRAVQSPTRKESGGVGGANGWAEGRPGCGGGREGGWVESNGKFPKNALSGKRIV